MRRLALVFLALMSLALTACDQVVPTPNGEIPETFKPFAEAWTGAYEGRFENNHAYLRLSLDGNKVLLDVDNILPNCLISVGPLKSVTVRQPKDGAMEVRQATFWIQKRFCFQEISGNDITVEFSRKNPGELYMSLLVKENNFPPYAGGQMPDHDPGLHNRYLWGSFKRWQ